MVERLVALLQPAISQVADAKSMVKFWNVIVVFDVGRAQLLKSGTALPATVRGITMMRRRCGVCKLTDTPSNEGQGERKKGCNSKSELHDGA